MGSVQRIDFMLEQLRIAWYQNPDMLLEQLIDTIATNYIIDTDDSSLYLSDDAMQEALVNFIQRTKP
jgi:hypothetical protein